MAGTAGPGATRGANPDRAPSAQPPHTHTGNRKGNNGKRRAEPVRGTVGKNESVPTRKALRQNGTLSSANPSRNQWVYRRRLRGKDHPESSPPGGPGEGTFATGPEVRRRVRGQQPGQLPLQPGVGGTDGAVAGIYHNVPARRHLVLMQPKDLPQAALQPVPSRRFSQFPAYGNPESGVASRIGFREEGEQSRRSPPSGLVNRPEIPRGKQPEPPRKTKLSHHGFRGPVAFGPSVACGRVYCGRSKCACGCESRASWRACAFSVEKSFSPRETPGWNCLCSAPADLFHHNRAATNPSRWCTQPQFSLTRGNRLG